MVKSYNNKSESDLSDRFHPVSSSTTASNEEHKQFEELPYADSLGSS